MDRRERDATRRTFALFVAVLMASSATFYACGDNNNNSNNNSGGGEASTLQDGVWGSDQGRLAVNGSEVILLHGCRTVSLNGPVSLNEDGSFTATGSVRNPAVLTGSDGLVSRLGDLFVTSAYADIPPPPGNGSPAAIPTFPAQVTGKVEGDRMEVRYVFTDETGEQRDYEMTLTRGEEGNTPVC